MLYPLESITPSVIEISQLLRARTKDAAGYEVGTFNDDTRPTSSQVAGLAVTAATDIQARLGTSPPEDIEDLARGVAALLAACMVEISYFPEQVQTGRSPFEQMRELLDLRLAVLTGWVGGDEGAVPPGELEARSFRIPVFERGVHRRGRRRPADRPDPGAHRAALASPTLALELQIAVAADGPQIRPIVRSSGRDRRDVVRGRRDSAADRADPLVSLEDPLFQPPPGPAGQSALAAAAVAAP
jgi:hypothetical protein